MLQNALQGLRTDGNNGDEAAANLQRLETLATAINDLQNEDRDMNVAAVEKQLYEEPSIKINFWK